MSKCDRAVSARAGEDQTREAMKESIVYLEISSYGYDQIRPWKNTDIQQKSGVGCATGAYQVITPAWNLTDAKLIKAKVSGQNEYIPATIKTIDYEIDLAILELEPNAMKKPLKPIKFEDKFQRGAKLNYYWLNRKRGDDHGTGVSWTGRSWCIRLFRIRFFEFDSYEYIAGNRNRDSFIATARRP